MLTVHTYALGSVILISLISFIGIFAISLNRRALKKYVFLLVSLAVGALLGDAFFHLIPEAFETAPTPVHVSFALLIGIMVFFMLEKVLHWHHHRHGDEHGEGDHLTGNMIIVSDGIHNLMDGLIIGASYLVSIEVGIATTLAVVLHEIPQEIGDFGVLIHSGYTRARALWLNFVSALFAVVGAGITLIVGVRSEAFALALLPFAAGGFIYVALSDLIPELHKVKGFGRSLLQFSVVLAGIGAMFLLLGLE